MGIKKKIILFFYKKSYSNNGRSNSNSRAVLNKKFGHFIKSKNFAIMNENKLCALNEVMNNVKMRQRLKF